MTVSDASSLMTALAAVGALYLSWRNGRKIKEVHDNTNSMKDELVAAVRANSLATGKAEGKAEAKAEERGTTDS